MIFALYQCYAPSRGKGRDMKRESGSGESFEGFNETKQKYSQTNK